MTDRTDWRVLIEQAIDTDPRGITGVAMRLGYSRPAVSRVINGTYGSTENFAKAVLAAYARIDCPHLKTSLAPDECRNFAGRSYRAITAAEVPHWRACKRCPHKPESQS